VSGRKHMFVCFKCINYFYYGNTICTTLVPEARFLSGISNVSDDFKLNALATVQTKSWVIIKHKWTRSVFYSLSKFLIVEISHSRNFSLLKFLFIEISHNYTAKQKLLHKPRASKSYIPNKKNVVQVLHKPISRPFSQQLQRVGYLSLKTCSKSTT
jgi:hypothetical protein